MFLQYEQLLLPHPVCAYENVPGHEVGDYMAGPPRREVWPTLACSSVQPLAWWALTPEAALGLHKQ